MMSYMHLPSVCAECAKLVGGKRGQRIAAKKCRNPPSAMSGQQVPSCAAARLSSWGCGSALRVLLWN